MFAFRCGQHNPFFKIIQRSITTKEYNLLLLVRSKQRDHGGVLEIFNRMKNEGEIPDCATYNILIGSAASNKAFNEGVGYFKEMISNDLRPNQHTFTYLFQLCAATKKQEKALGYFYDMRQYNIPVNDILKTAVVDAFSSCKIQNDNLNLLKRIENFIEKEILVDVGVISVINAVVKFYISQDRTVEANKLIESIPSKYKLNPDTITNNLIIQLNKNDLDFVFSHFEKMKKTKHVNQRTFVSLFSILKNKNIPPEKLEELCKYLDDCNLEKNIFVYSSLIDCLLSYGMYDSIFDNYQKMKDNFIKPNDTILIILLRACSQYLTSSSPKTKQQLDYVHAIFDDAITLKLTPTTINNREFTIFMGNLLEYHFRVKSSSFLILKLLEAFKSSQFYTNTRLKSIASHLVTKYQPSIDLEALLTDLAAHKKPR